MFEQAVEAALAQVAEAVRERLADDALAAPEQRLDLLGEGFARALVGGKRLRAAFVHAGWSAVERGAGALAEPELVLLAASFEVFHASALVHDDVIDGAPTRRGQPSIHRWLSDAAGSEQGQLSGEALAILVGDLLLIEADRLAHLAMAEADLPLRNDILALLDSTRSTVIAGQFLDTLAPTLPMPDPDTQAAHAWRVLKAKSADYSVAAPLRLGALAAAATPEALDALAQYGQLVGEGFQLRDDLLGVFGTEEETGKPVGSDLRDRKQTVLLATTRRRLKDDDREFFDALLLTRAPLAPREPHHPPADAIIILRELISLIGARREVERMITSRHKAALAALAPLPHPQPLRRLARLTLTRRR